MTTEGTAVMDPGPSSRPHYVIVAEERMPAIGFRELWDHRGLLFFLTWRDLKVRYRQTLLGAAWVVLQPGIGTLVFSLLFGLMLKVPTKGVPYPAFFLAGLLPWNLFASCLARSALSVVGNAQLLSKVYFPRLILPLSAFLSSLLDFAVACLVLGLVFVYFGLSWTPRLLLLPPIAVLLALAGLGVGLWLGALNVRFRDVGLVLPLLLQVGLYLTPVIYTSDLIPRSLRPLLALNPVAGLVEAFRWTLLTPDAPFPLEMGHFLTSLGTALLLVVGGIFFFRALERTFADVV